jgi:hypothetical protein
MTIPEETLYTSRALGLGRIAEHNAITNIRSFAAESDNIIFGRALKLGTDLDKQVDIFNVASGTFAGVAGYSTDASNIDNSKFNDDDSVPVIDQGVVTVYTEEAVEPNSAVRIRHNAAGPGNFRTTADPGNTVRVTAGAEYRESAASGTAVKLFLSPPFSITAD